MVSSTSRLSYTDCYEAFDKALEDPVGVRIHFDYSGDANHFRLRLHAARRVDRAANREAFDLDHPLYGKSIYDELVVRIRRVDDEIYLYIEHLPAMETEALSKLDGHMVKEPTTILRRI